MNYYDYFVHHTWAKAWIELIASIIYIGIFVGGLVVLNKLYTKLKEEVRPKIVTAVIIWLGVGGITSLAVLFFIFFPSIDRLLSPGYYAVIELLERGVK